MAKERVQSFRNTGTADDPVWEKYFPNTTADAVFMSDDDNETKTAASEIQRLSTALDKFKVTKVAAGDTNGTLKVTPDSGEASDITIYTHPTIEVSASESTIETEDGGTVAVIGSVTTDAAGHVTAIGTKNLVLPPAYVHPTIDEPKEENPTAVVLTEGGELIVKEAIVDDAGHVTGIVNRKYTLPTAEGVTDITGNAGTADKLKTPVEVKITGAVTGTAGEVDGSGTVNISATSIDGSKVTGIIPLTSIPKAAQETLIKVADDTERFALTTEQVQNGDSVQVLYKDGSLTGSDLTKKSNQDGRMYLVVDDTKLDSEDGYTVYTAGAAASVDWSGVTNAPVDSAYDEESGTWTGGLITAAQAEKLDGLDNYTHPTYETSEANDASENLAFGDSATFVSGVVVENGHVTKITKKQVTLPTIKSSDLPTVTVSSSDTTAAPAHGESFTVIKEVTTDNYGRVTAIKTVEVTLPEGNKIEVKDDTTVDKKSVASNGKFTVVTGVEQDGDDVTVKKAEVTVPTVTFATSQEGMPTDAPAGSICFLIQ